VVELSRKEEACFEDSRYGTVKREPVNHGYYHGYNLNGLKALTAVESTAEETKSQGTINRRQGNGNENTQF